MKRGTGIIRENVPIKLKLGFRRDGVPVMALYEKEGDVFVCQMTFDEEEIAYFKQYFNQFG